MSYRMDVTTSNEEEEEATTDDDGGRRADERRRRRQKQEKRRRGESLNRTVLDLLAQSLGQSATGRRSNGLAKLGGTWSEQQYEQFEAAVASTERIEEELWR